MTFPEILPVIQYPLVNKFYSSNKARSKAKGNETVWVVKKQSTIIAAARVADICGCDFLTGVHVAEAFQGQGVASAMISALVKDVEKPLYTFPYSHLMQMYGKLGFIEIAQEKLPKPLLQRFGRYRGQGRDIVPAVFMPDFT